MWVTVEVLNAQVTLERRSPLMQEQVLRLRTDDGVVEITTDINTLLELRDQVNQLERKRETADAATPAVVA